MEILGIIGSVLLTLIILTVKNWGDIKVLKKSVSKLIEDYNKYNADGKWTNKEKDKWIEQVLVVIRDIIPIFASLWKVNWKAKRKIKDVVK